MKRDKKECKNSQKYYVIDSQDRKSENEDNDKRDWQKVKIKLKNSKREIKKIHIPRKI